MPSLLDNYPEPQGRPVTFAEPDETLSYGERLAKLGRPLDVAGAIANPIGAFAASAAKDIITNPAAFADLFGSAEKQTRLVDNAFASDQAREQAYDRRIAAVKDATGVELENPDRGGYRPTGHEMAALAREGPVDPWAVGRQRFEQQLAAVRDKNPDKAGDLQFGSIDDEAQAIAKGADGDYDAARKATPLGTPASLVAEFGGSTWGQRRDPFFVGSLVAGPTSAVGRTVAARILTSGLFQGLYTAGLSALEQPAVQAWRQQIGLRSGIVPAAEQVGMAFLSGMIPGAALRGVHEGLTAPLRRVLTGIPEAGDLDKAMAAAKSALGEIDAGMTVPARAAIKLGEDMDAATRATAPVRAKDVPPELHDDMTTAAQRHGEDPIGQPSPAAVAVVDRAQNYGPSDAKFYGEPLPTAGVAPANIAADGAIYVGKSNSMHYLISEKFAEKIRQDMNLQPGEPTWRSEGFVTPDGQFLDRKQAFQWVSENEKRVRSSDNMAENELDALDYYEQVPERKRARRQKPVPSEVQDRVEQAQPRTEREAQMAATEALEDIGNRGSIAATTEALERDKLPAATEGFTTAKGSTYQLHPDGTTTRNKAERTDVGHEGDFGAKPRTERTVYVDDARLASALSAAGLQGLGPKGARVIIKDGKASLLTWNEKAGQWGRSEISKDIPVSDKPEVGKAPLELWKKTDDVPGYEAYSKMHAGNAITELRTRERPAASSKDPLDKIPLARDDGTPTLVSAQQAARAGERETKLADLIRECK